MSECDIAARVEALRLPVSELAQRAGLNKHTVYRTLHGRTAPLASTRDRLLEAVQQEEVRMRNYLCGLHGAPEAAQ